MTVDEMGLTRSLRSPSRNCFLPSSRSHPLRHSVAPSRLSLASNEDKRNRLTRKAALLSPLRSSPSCSISAAHSEGIKRCNLYDTVKTRKGEEEETCLHPQTHAHRLNRPSPRACRYPPVQRMQNEATRAKSCQQ